MTCKLNNELLEYLDNEAEPGQCAEIEAHLKDCAECRDELESLNETQTLWRNTLHPHALKPNFHIRVKERYTKTVFRRWVLRLAIAGAAAVWMLVIILLFLNSSSMDTPVPLEPIASVGAGHNEITSQTNEQPITTSPIAAAIVMQTEKHHFHILHKKQPMLSIFIKMAKRRVDGIDDKDIKEAAAELVKLLSDKDGEVRAVAAASLGEFSAAESIPELLKVLNDPYAGARGWAAITLIELGARDKVPEEAIANINLILNNSDDNYRARAQDALDKLEE